MRSAIQRRHVQRCRAQLPEGDGIHVHETLLWGQCAQAAGQLETGHRAGVKVSYLGAVWGACLRGQDFMANLDPSVNDGILEDSPTALAH